MSVLPVVGRAFEKKARPNHKVMQVIDLDYQALGGKVRKGSLLITSMMHSPAEFSMLLHPVASYNTTKGHCSGPLQAGRR